MKKYRLRDTIVLGRYFCKVLWSGMRGNEKTIKNKSNNISRNNLYKSYQT